MHRTKLTEREKGAECIARDKHSRVVKLILLSKVCVIRLANVGMKKIML